MTLETLLHTIPTQAELRALLKKDPERYIETVKMLCKLAKD